MMKKQPGNLADRPVTFRDLADMFVASASNVHTQRARKSDMREFVRRMGRSALDNGERHPGKDISAMSAAVTEGNAFLASFLAMEPWQATALLKTYQAHLIAEGFRDATINRRLMTVRGFIRFARESGLTQLEVEKSLIALYSTAQVVSLRESECHELISAPATRKLRDLRNGALLALLCEVALQSGQVGEFRVADYRTRARKLRVPVESSDDGVWVQLSKATCDRINRYLRRARIHRQPESPLFRNLDRRPQGGAALTSKSVLKIVQDYGEFIGYMHLTPRTLRCTAIIHALDKVEGNIAEAMQQYPHITHGTWEYYRQHYEEYKRKSAKNRRVDF